ncbi:MAG TPA: chromate efflux transporter [Steroidobacteraceae bacterium]
MPEVFWTALKLGLTSFGGPIAHLGYFEQTYVRKLRWLTSEAYAELVALCQTLPGPTSSQVGFLVGLRRAGWPGAVAAWVGFTLPSALLMYACAMLATVLAPQGNQAWWLPVLHGLLLTAVAVVAQAVWSMARSLCPDWPRRALAALSCAALLLFASPATQVSVMALGALAGLGICRGASSSRQAEMGRNNASPRTEAARTLPEGPAITGAGMAHPVGPRTAAVALVSYVLLLGALTSTALLAPRGPLALAAIFYRAGALVFGGGHVVLPLLRQELVPGGWLSDSGFLSGYALAQGLPGPLFTVAAYLGAVSAPVHQAAAWSVVAILAIFLPGLLLAAGGVSLWSRIAAIRGAAAALAGVNAAVVGILAAALYDPVWISGVHDLVDAVTALAAFVLLQRWRLPAPAIAGLCVGVSVVRGLISL